MSHFCGFTKSGLTHIEGAACVKTYCCIMDKKDIRVVKAVAALKRLQPTEGECGLDHREEGDEPMKIEGRILTGVLSLFLTTLFFASVSFTGDAPRITKEEAKALLGDPRVLILDARIGGAWAKSDRKIKGAVRVDPSAVNVWARTLRKDRKIIVYCS